MSLHLCILAAHQLVAIGGGNVLEELFDEIDVGKNHAAAAVALETDLVEGLKVGVLGSSMNEVSYASSLPSLRMVMYFSHRSPVT